MFVLLGGVVLGCGMQPVGISRHSPTVRRGTYWQNAVHPVTGAIGVNPEDLNDFNSYDPDWPYFNDFAHVANGDVLEVASEPNYHRIYLTYVGQNIVRSGGVPIALVFRNTTDKRQIMIPLVPQYEYNQAFPIDLDLSPFCFNEIEIRHYY